MADLAHGSEPNLSQMYTILNTFDPNPRRLIANERFYIRTTVSFVSSNWCCRCRLCRGTTLSSQLTQFEQAPCPHILFVTFFTRHGCCLQLCEILDGIVAL